MQEPLVSIPILTYNQQDTIGRTLDSILAQETRFTYEIIIGEDCSQDNTRIICEDYVRRYPDKISLLPAAPNKGLLNNMRDVYALCSGKYLAGCAGDDWWHNPRKVQMQVEYLESHPDCGVVHTDMDIWLVDSKRKIPATGTRRPPEGDIHNNLYKVCFINAPTTMYRRELLSYINLDKFIELDFKMEDYPMWFEMSRHTKFHFINESTVTYSVFANSLSHSDNIDARIKFLDETKKVQDYYYSLYQPDLDIPLHFMQNRMYYMECLKYGAYSHSFKYVNLMGFPLILRVILHTYIGGWCCNKIIQSSFYKHKKGLQ